MQENSSEGGMIKNAVREAKANSDRHEKQVEVGRERNKRERERKQEGEGNGGRGGRGWVRESRGGINAREKD
eukprot:754311-Hanusia_phi.AAC.1